MLQHDFDAAQIANVREGVAFENHEIRSLAAGKNPHLITNPEHQSTVGGRRAYGIQALDFIQ
jgi:hypothetical protein